VTGGLSHIMLIPAYRLWDWRFTYWCFSRFRSYEMLCSVIG